MNNIQMIKIGKLFPHPKNPRKDLGDLTELRESIKENGIMQNLTVVARPDFGYWVVIGNRRLAAASGVLEELPCVISDMDEKTQQATMLMENMQRNDLTIGEQVKGVQMCLDLGLKESDIVKATGLSKKTISSRKKLSTYNSEDIDKWINGGATLDDFAKLWSIKDEQRRKRCEQCLGTSSFNWEVEDALSDQETEEVTAKVPEAFKDKAENFTEDYKTETKGIWEVKFKAPKNKEWSRVRAINEYEDLKYDFQPGKEYAFAKFKDYYYLFVLKEVKKKENDNWSVNDKKREEKREKAQKMEAICQKTRKAFYDKLTDERIKKVYSKEDLLRMIIKGAEWYSLERYEFITGLEFADEEEAIDKLNLNSLVDLFKFYIARFDTDVIGWNGDFRNFGGDVNDLYEILEKLGYEESDEEKAYYDGTHECWKEE